MKVLILSENESFIRNKLKEIDKKLYNIPILNDIEFDTYKEDTGEFLSIIISNHKMNLEQIHHNFDIVISEEE